MTLREENEEYKKLYEDDGGKSYKPLNLSIADRIRMKEQLNNQNWLYDDTCHFCDKTIEQVGGKKISSSHFIKIFISDKFLGGGDFEYPYQSVKLDDNRYLTFKGKLSVWTKSAVKKAASFVQQGHEIWFCQVCANRTCHVCSSPTQRPQGCDLLDENVHVAILGAPSGCTNSGCEKHLD